MPSFPSSPIPRDISPPGIVENTISFQSDDGPEVTRSRFSRGLRAYALFYLVNHNELMQLQDFIRRQTRGRAITFDWTYPHAHTITNENTSTPIQVTTQNAHGLITNDQVVVTGTTAANGTHVVTRISNTVVQLVGTTGGAGGTSGSLAPYFPRMRFASDQFPIPTRLQGGFGPPRDNHGLWQFVLQLEEAF